MNVVKGGGCPNKLSFPRTTGVLIRDDEIEWWIEWWSSRTPTLCLVIGRGESKGLQFEGVAVVGEGGCRPFDKVNRHETSWTRQLQKRWLFESLDNIVEVIVDGCWGGGGYFNTMGKKGMGFNEIKTKHKGGRGIKGEEREMVEAIRVWGNR
jgi:hypothetical protein